MPTSTGPAANHTAGMADGQLGEQMWRWLHCVLFFYRMIRSNAFFLHFFSKSLPPLRCSASAQKITTGLWESICYSAFFSIFYNYNTAPRSDLTWCQKSPTGWRMSQEEIHFATKPVCTSERLWLVLSWTVHAVSGYSLTSKWIFRFYEEWDTRGVPRGEGGFRWWRGCWLLTLTVL